MMRESDLETVLATDAWATSVECPSIERLVEVAEGAAPAKEELRVRTHAASCPRCDAELELAASFFESEAISEEGVALASELERHVRREIAVSAPVAAQASSVRSWPRGWWLIAATALLALALLPIFRSSGPLSIPPPVEDGIARGATLDAVEPLGRIERAPERFRWNDRDGVDRYRIDLRRVDRSVIWSGEIEGDEIALPMSVIETLHERTKYHWLVIGLDGEGRVVASSREVGFVIDPPSR